MDIVYFDLETQRTANDVGGWDKKHEMGMSVGVTYSTADQAYEIFPENRAGDLVTRLQRADLVVGYNIVSFDYEVLMAYTILDLPHHLPTLDLLLEVEKAAGHRLKLDDIAQGTLGVGKIAEGLDAIRWWREGKLDGNRGILLLRRQGDEARARTRGSSRRAFFQRPLWTEAAHRGGLEDRMIQPLKSSKTNWLISWIDLEEPVPSGPDFFLPTLLIVSDVNGAPLGAPEVLEELDQLRVENYLIKLFEKLGPPDRLTVSVSEDWDEDAWKAFSQEQHLEIRFQKFDKREPEEIRALARSIVLRFVSKESTAPRSTDIARGLGEYGHAHPLAAEENGPPPHRARSRRRLRERAHRVGRRRVSARQLEGQPGRLRRTRHPRDSPLEGQAPRLVDRSRDPPAAPRPLRPRHDAVAPGTTRRLRRAIRILLKLSPKDYQGARFFIPLLYLLSEEFEAAQAAFEQYAVTYPGTIPSRRLPLAGRFR